MKTVCSLSIAAGMTAVLAASANAGFSFTQQASQTTTYANQLNFDEPGTPTGLVPANTWASLGINIHNGDSPNNTYVDNFSNDLPWLPNNNASYNVWGCYIDLSTAATGFSFQAWDTSGPPSFFGGGLLVGVADANGNLIDGLVFNPAWGGIGDTWFNITATGGDSFSHIVIAGMGFFPETFVDNLSWNTVPGPGAMALLGLGLVRGRRRSA
ncbi:MAG: hypothetical protein U0636_06615 [Phycisphaerales bacterium]